MKAQELLNRTRMYIGHSFHVWSNAKDKSSMNNAKILEQISFCRKTISGINRFSGSKQVCKEILAIRKQLLDILPGITNNSYKQSLTEINDIISICEEEIKLKSDEKIHT